MSTPLSSVDPIYDGIVTKVEGLRHMKANRNQKIISFILLAIFLLSLLASLLRAFTPV